MVGIKDVPEVQYELVGAIVAALNEVIGQSIAMLDDFRPALTLCDKADIVSSSVLSFVEFHARALDTPTRERFTTILLRLIEDAPYFVPPKARN